MTFLDPSSLLHVSQGIWVTINNFNATSNLMGNSSSTSYGLVTLYEPQTLVQMNTLIFKTVQSSTCSNTYKSIYGSSCSSVKAGFVGTPMIYLSESTGATNTRTPTFTIQNIEIQSVDFYKTGSSSSFLLNVDNYKSKQQDFQITKAKAINVESAENYLLLWKGAKFTIKELEVANSHFLNIVGSSSSKDSLGHQLVIEEVKLTSTACTICFRVENQNTYTFVLKNSDTQLYYFDTVTIQNYFLTTKYTAANSIGTHTIENIKLTNVVKNSTSSMIIFQSDKGGDFTVKNLHFYTRPSKDGGKLLQLSATDSATFSFQGLVHYNADGSSGNSNSQAILLTGQNLKASFLQNNITGFKQSLLDGTIAVKGSTVTDSNSHYELNFASQGGVYFISESTSSLKIENGLFLSNQADKKGGAIIQQGGHLTVLNSNFTNNTAQSFGGVYSNLGEGIFNFTDNIFIENLSKTLGSVFHSLSNPDTTGNVIQNCLFGENWAQDFGTINMIFTQAIIKNITLRNNYANRKTEGLSLTQSTVTIEDSLFYNTTSSSTTRDLNQLYGSLLYITEESHLTLSGSTFTGGKAVTGGAIQVQGSATLYVNNCTFYDNVATNFGADIYGISYATLSISNSFFSHSSSSLGLFQAVDKALIQNNSFSSYVTKYPVVYIQEAKMLFKNNTIKGFIGLTRPVFQASSTTECVIESSTFEDIIAQRAVAFISASVTSLSQTLHKITSSNFTNIQASQDGGAIVFQNMHGVIQSNTFTSCSNSQYDKRGGAIFITETADTTVKIENNKFQSCRALIGGAVAFANYEPAMTGNTFSSNAALLSGNDKASYPQKSAIISSVQYQQVRSKRTTLDNGASNRYQIDSTALSTQINAAKVAFLAGQRQLLLTSREQAQWHPFIAPARDLQTSTLIMKSGASASTIYVGLLDNYNQIVPDLDKSNSITLTAKLTTSSAQFTGILSNYTQVTEQDGVFQVQGVSVTGEPGTTVSLDFTASFDTTKELSISAKTNVSQSISLNSCVAGEAFLDTGQCLNCPSTFYLLTAPTAPTSCNSCDQNGQCFGGDRIGPKAGYWRSSSASQNFILCFNINACLGSSDDSNYDPQGTCQTGYNGILCAQCDTNYVRNSSFQCAKCPEMWQNVLLIIFVIAIVVGIIVVIVKITLKSQLQPRSPFSAYFKIMTNHLHLIFLTASFELNWPDIIKDFFDSTEPVANVGDRIISVDCFMDTSGFTSVPRPYVYLLIYLFLPFIIVFLSFIIWKIIYRQNRATMCNRSITTIIILLFLVHPSITTQLIRVFHCYKIDSDFHLVRDLSQKCWTSNHLAWALGGSLPGIILWGIGIPLVSFLILRYVRFDLDQAFIKEKYGFLYNGYKRRNYYWESVIMFRKVAMIFITVFISSLGRIVQALAVIVLLVFYLFITIRKKPYTTRRLNELEITSLLTSATTIYSGVFFLSSRSEEDPSFTPNVDMTLSEETKWILVIVIILSNVIFLVFWVYFFCKDVRLSMAKSKKAQKVFKICCLCCRSSRFKISKLNILKGEQDAQIVNEIQNLEADLNIIKGKYIWDRKFREKWQFEDFLRDTQKGLDQLDVDKMKLKIYRDIHSLEESQMRGEKKEEEHFEYEEELERQRNTDPAHKKSSNSINALRRCDPLCPDDVKIEVNRPCLAIRETETEREEK